MGRLISAAQAVNANIRQILDVDLDAAALPAELGVIPAAVRAYIAASEQGDTLFHRTVLTCTALPISVADDAGQAQYGGAQVYTFPAGLIATFGAQVTGNLTMGATGTFIDAFTGVNSLGSAVRGATGAATLVSTAATWLQSTANATAAAKVAAISSVSIATQVTESGGRVYDGRAAAAPVFLNFAIADDGTHTAGTGTFTGVITLLWAKVSP